VPSSSFKFTPLMLPAAPEAAIRHRHPAGVFFGHKKSPRQAGDVAD
jgi:hypothetical protein